MPLFLTVTLGAPVAVIGLIEGMAEGVSVGLCGVAGALSDRYCGRRLPWVTAGYAATTLSRPLLALASGWGVVLGARLLDRAGKAIRTAPRDALLVASVGAGLLWSHVGHSAPFLARAASAAAALMGLGVAGFRS